MDSGDGWDICHLFVQAPHRNTGIGQALIAEVQKAAKAAGTSRLTIGAAPNNPGAAAAYPAMGHHEITGSSGPRFSINIPA